MTAPAAHRRRDTQIPRMWRLPTQPRTGSNSAMTSTETAPDPTRSTDWMKDAACRGENTDLYFTSLRGPAGDRQDQDAKRVCRRCAVVASCLAWALVALPFGVAGGLTADERRLARRRSKRAAS